MLWDTANIYMWQHSRNRSEEDSLEAIGVVGLEKPWALSLY